MTGVPQKLSCGARIELFIIIIIIIIVPSLCTVLYKEHNIGQRAYNLNNIGADCGRVTRGNSAVNRSVTGAILRRVSMGLPGE